MKRKVVVLVLLAVLSITAMTVQLAVSANVFESPAAFADPILPPVPVPCCGG